MIRHLLAGLGLSVACVGTSYGFGGLYLGADLGLGYSTNQHDYADANGAGKTTKTAFGAVYGAHVGYLYEIGTSKTIVGAEIYGNLTSMNPSFKFGADGFPVQGDVKIKRKNSLGLAVLIGKMFNIKTMIYGRLAYERAAFDHEYKFDTTSYITQYAGQSIKKSVSIMAPVIGLGLAYKPARAIIVGGEYQFAGLYGKKKVISDSNFQTEISPVEHRLLLKISFVFG